MAAFKQDKNTGALFNNKKKTEQNHPDFTGKINCDGKDYYISAWKKTSDNGNWISLAIREFIPREEFNGNKANVDNDLTW